MAKLSILKVFEFSSQTLRSGVVVGSEDAPPGSALLFLRGALAVIKAPVEPATIPYDFDQASLYLETIEASNFAAMGQGISPLTTKYHGWCVK